MCILGVRKWQMDKNLLKKQWWESQGIWESQGMW